MSAPTATAIKADVDRVFTLFPRLKERRRQTAGTLSGGEQQMLAMGRALMSRPKLLLLDEPSMGLAPLMVQKVFETVLAVSQEGVTILLIEQNAKLALEVSDRGYVMESGEITLQGEAQRCCTIRRCALPISAKRPDPDDVHPYAGSELPATRSRRPDPPLTIRPARRRRARYAAYRRRGRCSGTPTRCACGSAARRCSARLRSSCSPSIWR